MCLSNTEMSSVNRNSSSVGETSNTSLTFPRRRNVGATGEAALERFAGVGTAVRPRPVTKALRRGRSHRAGVERGDRPEPALRVEPDRDLVLRRELGGDHAGALLLQLRSDLAEEELPDALPTVDRKEV